MTTNHKPRKWIRWIIACIVFLVLGCLFYVWSGGSPVSPPYPEKTVDLSAVTRTADSHPPNIILINADDLGYGDLGCYGGKAIQTPHIDRLAHQGVRFTHFYACDSVCTPSRAGLLTGRYPVRMNFCYPIYAKDMTLQQALMFKLGEAGTLLGSMDIATEKGPAGLHHFEITIAEALKAGGYRTGMVGKWHLGDYSINPEYNPVRHGFDFYYGVPHSNDMYPFPLYRNEQELEAHVEDQGKLTRLYTEEAIAFIEANGDDPFFLYFAHTFPHRPLFASKAFTGKSMGGTFGDTVEEIDWSVGKIMESLQKKGLDKQTMVMFTSDNGPWYQGSTGGLRGRKGQSWEGGQRVPFIVQWPDRIHPGRIADQPAMNIDLLPTCLAVAGLTIPTDRVIDGHNIQGLFIDPAQKAPDRPLFFYHIGELESVRLGNWKYVQDINHYTWPMPVNKNLGHLNHHTSGPLPLLFNLEKDPLESYNLIDKFPGKAEKMAQIINQWQENLTMNQLGIH